MWWRNVTTFPADLTLPEINSTEAARFLKKVRLPTFVLILIKFCLKIGAVFVILLA